MWVYRKLMAIEKKKPEDEWGVGYCPPVGGFQVVERFADRDEAANRVHYLNGGSTDELARQNMINNMFP